MKRITSTICRDVGVPSGVMGVEISRVPSFVLLPMQDKMEEFLMWCLRMSSAGSKFY